MEKEPTLRVRNGKKKKAHKYILSVSLVTDTSIYIYVVQRDTQVYTELCSKETQLMTKRKKKVLPSCDNEKEKRKQKKGGYSERK